MKTVAPAVWVSCDFKIDSTKGEWKQSKHPLFDTLPSEFAAPKHWIHNWNESEVMTFWCWTSFVILWTNYDFISILSSSLCSLVLLSTASLHGSVTSTCHCWTDCMSTTPPNTHVGFSCARTTDPMKLSSSRCEPSTWPCVKHERGDSEKAAGIIRWEGEVEVWGKGET